MRVAVVFFNGKSRDKVRQLAAALGKGIEKQGHQVDLFDGVKDANVKLTIYQYLVIGAEGVSAFGGKLPEQVHTFLAAAGVVSGKKSFAFVPTSTFGSAKALSLLMKAMEGEGMFLKNSEIVRSPQEAEEIGKRLHVS
jgi:menaquinone-dependent protoporphyrinogen IX oxidase